MMSQNLTFQAYATLKVGEKLQTWQYEARALGSNDKKFGAHYFCNWNNSTEIEAASASLDLMISTVSSEIDGEKAFSLLGNNGILCLLGLPVSTLNIPLLSLVFGQKLVDDFL